eukprot:NODE_556_length_6708_cov_0.674837.p1 type:complete len:888 gc:universal NODE_556_length_6708_cov_0.674837:4180-1517(-)
MDQLASELINGNISVEKQFISSLSPDIIDQCQPNTKFLIWSYLRKHPKLSFFQPILNIISRFQVALNAADPTPYNSVGNLQSYKMMCFAYASICLQFNKPLLPEQSNIDLQTLLYILDEIASVKLYTKRRIVSQILNKALDQNSILLITKSLEAIEDDNSVIPDMQYRKPLLDLVNYLLDDQSELNLNCLAMIVKMRRSCISYQDRRDLIKVVFSKLQVSQSAALSIILTIFDLHMGMEFEDLPEIQFILQSLLALPINTSTIKELILIYKHCLCDLRLPAILVSIDKILEFFINCPIYEYPFEEAISMYDDVSKMIRDRYQPMLPILLSLQSLPLLCLGSCIFKQKINIYEVETNDQYDAELFNRLITIDKQLNTLHLNTNVDADIPISYFTLFIKNITENYIWDSFCFNQLFFKQINCTSRLQLFELLLTKCFDILQQYFNNYTIVTLIMDVFTFFSHSITCTRFASESNFLLQLQPSRTLLFEHVFPKYRINYYQFLGQVAFTNKTNVLYDNIMHWISSTCTTLSTNTANTTTTETSTILSMTGLMTDVFYLNEAIGLIYAMMGLLMGSRSEQGLNSVIDCLLVNILPFLNHIYEGYSNEDVFLYAICKLGNCLYENDLMSTFKQNKIIFVLYRDVGLLMMRVMGDFNKRHVIVRPLQYMLRFQSQFLTEHLFFSAMIFYKDQVLLSSLQVIYQMILNIDREICQYPKFLTIFSKWFKRGLMSDLFNIEYNQGFIDSSKLILTINMEYEHEDLKSGAIEVIRDWTRRCTQNETLFGTENSMVINGLREDIEILKKWLWLMIVDYMGKDENGETIGISCCVHNILLLINIENIQEYMQYYGPELWGFIREIPKDMESAYSWANIEKVAQNMKECKVNLMQHGIML